MAPHILIGREADPLMRNAIADALTGYAAVQGVRDVHDVRVRGTADGLVVNYHCRVDDPLTVEAAHEAVDAIERRLREEFPTILRVAGHSEPSEA
jgi:divalent metal cation (Fe/Co/Zn/Cd) transporter